MDNPVPDRHDASLFSQSLAAALIFGVVGGLLMMAIGIAIATNWRGWAEHYSDWTGLFLPARRPDFDQRLVRQNRIIFGVVAAFGAALFVGGLISSRR